MPQYVAVRGLSHQKHQYSHKYQTELEWGSEIRAYSGWQNCMVRILSLIVLIMEVKKFIKSLLLCCWEMSASFDALCFVKLATVLYGAPHMTCKKKIRNHAHDLAYYFFSCMSCAGLCSIE